MPFESQPSDNVVIDIRTSTYERRSSTKSVFGKAFGEKKKTPSRFVIARENRLPVRRRKHSQPPVAKPPSKDISEDNVLEDFRLKKAKRGHRRNETDDEQDEDFLPPAPKSNKPPPTHALKSRKIQPASQEPLSSQNIRHRSHLQKYMILRFFFVIMSRLNIIYDLLNQKFNQKCFFREMSK